MLLIMLQYFDHFLAVFYFRSRYNYTNKIVKAYVVDVYVAADIQQTTLQYAVVGLYYDRLFVCAQFTSQHSNITNHNIPISTYLSHIIEHHALFSWVLTTLDCPFRCR